MRQGQDKSRARDKAGGKAGNRARDRTRQDGEQLVLTRLREIQLKGGGLYRKGQESTKFSATKTRPRKVACSCHVHVVFVI